MRRAPTAMILVVVLALIALVVEVAAGDDPTFVKWLVVDDPGDETIRAYWERASAGTLSPQELVDLGTMLYYRGWSKDAIEYFNQALKAEPEMAEAWFRIGLVKHDNRDLDGARSAYKNCLDRQSGHGWANFYMGLLEEQTGSAKSAMKYYETAFKHAPGLVDPRINPEILSSRLQLGAQVRHFDRERFERSAPMPFLEPATMRKVNRQVQKEQAAAVPSPATGPQAAPTPKPEPATDASAIAGGAAAGKKTAKQPRRRGGARTTPPPSGGTPYGVPDEAARAVPYGVATPVVEQGSTKNGAGSARRVGDVSPEVSLGPAWQGLYRLAELFV